MKLLAVSMRVAAETTYREDRDAIARDWWPFLRAALPGHLPVPIPNDASYARQILALPGMVGLLLTGGNDVGSQPARDVAEDAAFEEARARGLPVLGVCRGMQFLAHLHGAALAPCDPAIHRATRHRIHADLPGSDAAREVNSYHGVGVVLPEGSPLEVRARSEDGGIEALRFPGRDILGILWHPEREAAPDPSDIALFTHLFDRNGNA